MKLLRRIMRLDLSQLILDQNRFYKDAWSPDSIRKWQLEQFNKLWNSFSGDIPYYAELKKQMGLPQKFSSWKEFSSRMPVTEKKDLQAEGNRMIHPIKAPDRWKSTGGSTGEPLRMSQWNSEDVFSNQDLWYARNWFGVFPSDKLFLIWGHSHLLGKGLPGKINKFKRNLKDKILGYHRYSAYDLSEDGLQECAKALLHFKPAYLVAYAAALDQFARINCNLKSEFHRLKLKVSIATAESFPREDSREYIRKILGCPVVMEYGAVETGPIAHETPENNFRIFWRHYLVEALEVRECPGKYEILVTSLYPRSCPLVRYRIGDLISGEQCGKRYIEAFQSVTGRCNDSISLPSGQVIHSEAFAHAVRDFPKISGYQMKQSPRHEITLCYVAKTPLEAEEIQEIRRRLRRIHPELNEISIDRVESLEQTRAGKTRRILS